MKWVGGCVGDLVVFFGLFCFQQRFVGAGCEAGFSRGAYRDMVVCFSNGVFLVGVFYGHQEYTAWHWGVIGWQFYEHYISACSIKQMVFARKANKQEEVKYRVDT